MSANEMKSSVIAVTIIQAVVTMALLAFSFAMRDKAPDLANTIVGFACAHWLNQSSVTGRQLVAASQMDNNGVINNGSLN